MRLPSLWVCPTCTNMWNVVQVKDHVWLVRDTSGLLGYAVEARGPRCPFCQEKMEIRSTVFTDSRISWPVFVN